MKYHMMAFLGGFILDLMFGDPYWLPHPIRGIGTLIAKTEKMLRRNIGNEEEKKLLKRGCMLTGIVIGVTILAAALILALFYRLHPLAGLAAETVMTYQILAAKCLKVESMKVYRHLKEKNPEAARQAVSMIVGRDTACLDMEGIAKAAIETVAENTSDGVIAPMLYTALGGPVLGFFYKAVNTMDSMVGYKNEKYLYFGRAAAKLDDLVNFIPARISAFLMTGACFFCEHFSFSQRNVFSAKEARRIYKRDNRKHASPNSAQTESVCAGALGLTLAGDASYFGKPVHKPTIGDGKRRAEAEDIRRVNLLMYVTAFLCEGLCLLGMVFFAAM